MTDFVVRVAGEAGEGPTTIGDFLARSAARSGYSVYTFQTFPAEIRGGHAYLQTRIAEQTTLSYGNRPDILLALNEDAFNRWSGLVPSDGLVMYDSSRFHVPGDLPFKAIGVPGENLAVSEVGSKIAQNVVMFGALAGLVRLDPSIAEALIRDRWKAKGAEVVASNLRAFEIGMRLVQEQNLAHSGADLTPRDDGVPRVILTGTQAMCLGAVAAGVRYFGGYPITPATQVMEWLGRHLPAFGGTVMQLEDEIAAIGSVLGASAGGVKAMTSTSGPGLSLMVELLGLASMAEVPLVVVDVQRAGPSTGMATKTAQGDLNLALYGAHGDAPRVVLAATSVEDSFYTTIRAFNLAERLQVPVILLSDQALATRISSVPRLDASRVPVENRFAFTPGAEGAEGAEGSYLRFRMTEDGISPAALPGTPGGMFTATGLEHDERGNPSAEPANRTRMLDKRARKMALALQGQDDLVRWWGDPEGTIGVMGWGSTEGVIREAVDMARAQGHPVIALHPRLLLPLPMDHVRRLLARCRRVLVPENNHSGQFAHYLRSQCHGLWDGQFVQWNKDDGTPFSPQEVYDGILTLTR
jgi:2-oxoglutarate/2-oxoacid ferredoxin oxidoreductase subunit alpha